MARATNKHATTHRSRGLGGTDPVPPDLPFIFGVCSSQTITADAEIEWDSVFTTDPDTFRYDNTDPAGLLLQRDGTYRFMAASRVAGGSISIERGMAVFAGLVSDGALGGAAVRDETQSFSSSWSDITTTIAASVPSALMWEHSIRGFFGSDVFDPYRIAVVMDHRGSTFTASRTTLYVEKIANLVGAVPPPPEEPPP